MTGASTASIIGLIPWIVVPERCCAQSGSASASSGFAR
jgi:hypothetical protein